MARPKNCREIGSSPGASYYKPKGVPYSELEEVVITLDEFEALKLADYAGLYQQKAAEMMGISRQTFGRIIDSAHRKIAGAFINGMALRIEGGDVRRRMMNEKCQSCAERISCESGNVMPARCLECGMEHEAGRADKI